MSNSKPVLNSSLGRKLIMSLTGVREAQQKVRARQAAMREFINATGRTRRYDRERIV